MAFDVVHIFMACIWLASYADGTMRRKLDDEKRWKHILPQPEWFCYLLEQRGGPNYAASVLHGLGGRARASTGRAAGLDGFMVKALVKVSASRPDVGILKNWDRESLPQKDYYACPSGGYEIRQNGLSIFQLSNRSQIL